MNYAIKNIDEWIAIPREREEANSFYALQEVKNEIVLDTYIEYSTKLLIEDHTSVIHKLKKCYEFFPKLTSAMNSLAILGISGILLYVLAGVKILHPIAFLWMIIAGTGMTVVIWTAIEEFYDAK